MRHVALRTKLVQYGSIEDESDSLDPEFRLLLLRVDTKPGRACTTQLGTDWSSSIRAHFDCQRTIRILSRRVVYTRIVSFSSNHVASYMP